MRNVHHYTLSSLPTNYLLWNRVKVGFNTWQVECCTHQYSHTRNNSNVSRLTGRLCMFKMIGCGSLRSPLGTNVVLLYTNQFLNKIIDFLKISISEPVKSDPPFKALHDWNDHLNRIDELNYIFPKKYPPLHRAMSPARELYVPKSRPRSIFEDPLRAYGYNYAGKKIADIFSKEWMQIIPLLTIDKSNSSGSWLCYCA